MMGWDRTDHSQSGDEPANYTRAIETGVPLPSREMTIAVIGDVHDHWDADDEPALRHLGVDLVLLVGDFGNEAVEVVRAIAALSLPKAVIFGNHDAWFSATEWGLKKCPYDRSQEDRVQQQIDLLGEAHVGYGKLDLPQFGLSVIGSRPFSWGGPDWKSAQFYEERYGVTSFVESSALMLEAVRQAAYETVIFIGHCGPTGLGDRPEDPCGRDWQPLGGDFGDPDLAMAIAQTRQLGKQVPLVAFGHMHHHLRHTQQHGRVPLVVGPEGTVYLNAACVPRIVRGVDHCRRNYSLVKLRQGAVVEASLVWVDQDLKVLSHQNLYRQAEPVASASSAVTMQ